MLQRNSQIAGLEQKPFFHGPNTKSFTINLLWFPLSRLHSCKKRDSSNDRDIWRSNKTRFFCRKRRSGLLEGPQHPVLYMSYLWQQFVAWQKQGPQYELIRSNFSLLFSRVKQKVITRIVNHHRCCQGYEQVEINHSISSYWCTNVPWHRFHTFFSVGAKMHSRKQAKTVLHISSFFSAYGMQYWSDESCVKKIFLFAMLNRI